MNLLLVLAGGGGDSEGGLLSIDPGLAIWTAIIFIILWVVLGKFAFKPIGQALRNRENSIQDALDQADKARAEMSAMKADHEKLLNEAKEERNNMLREAKETKDNIITEARDTAKVEYQKIVNDAKVEINNQKMAAMIEIKNKTGNMAIDIAQKVLRKELNTKNDQESFVKDLIEEIKLN